MAADEIEMVEIGPGDIGVLIEALRKLNNGIDALKLTVSYLNERVAELQKAIGGLEKALQSHLDSMHEEREHFEKEVESLLGELDERNARFAKDIKLSLDLFLERMSRRLDKLQESIEELNGDVAALRAQMREYELLATDAANTVKAETSSVRSKVSEMEALIAELSSRIDRLEGDIIAANRENQAVFGEILTRLSAIEKMLKGESLEAEAGLS